VVAGEPLRRRVLASAARPSSNRVWWRTGAGAPVAKYSYGPAGAGLACRGRHGFWMELVSNPLWIALTAPGLWVSDRFRRPPSPAGGPVSGP